MRPQLSGAEGFEDVNFRIRRSDNCGKNWSWRGDSEGVRIHPAQTVSSLFISDFGNLAKTNTLQAMARAKSSDAWVAANQQTGDVVAAYLNRDDSKLAQIYLARS